VKAAASLLSPSSVIDAALRAHHKHKLLENPYVSGQCYFEAQSVSNMLTHGTGEKKGSKLLRFLYANFYGGSMAQLWPLKNWLYQTKLQNNLWYSAAIAEAEDASEREAALVLSSAMLLAHWAWGSDGFLRNCSEMMRTIICNRVTPNLLEYRWKWFFGVCQTAKLGGALAKDHVSEAQSKY
jgi:hypothetical protein